MKKIKRKFKRLLREMLTKDSYSAAAKRRIVAYSLILAVVFLFSVISIGQAVSNNIETKEMLKDKEIEYIQMQEKKKVLENDLMRLDDPEYISQFIRDDHYYTAEGEIFFLLPEEEDTNDQTTNP